MAEDWRVTATLQDEEHAARFLQALHERQVEDDVRRRLGRRVVVSAGDSHVDSRVFVYADTEGAAQEAGRVVREVMVRHGLSADLALDRWHPLEEEWEDASVPMPHTARQRQAEHQRLMDEEAAESEASGLAAWEVRVELRSRRDAVEFADRLKGQGEPVARRWKFLVVGADNEDGANDLARKIEREAPAGATIHVLPEAGTT